MKTNSNESKLIYDLNKKQKICVLLVDDQTFIGKMIGNMLNEDNEIIFYFCQDAKMAIHMANDVKPTVILQDLTMPDVDGLTMVRFYRLNKHTSKIPLIVLSGHEDAKIKASAFELGANDYMVKPPDKIELLARIKYHSQSYNNMLERDNAYIKLETQSKELELRNQFIKKTFGRYLSDEIVKSILDTPDGLELGGEKRKVTIMMTDIRGFTSISERLPPEDVLGMINTYLEVMTEIILKYRGTIDEFIGDAILVIFGAPLADEDDTIRAIACSVEMQLAMKIVNQKNIDCGYPEVEMGIGINTGNVVVGNIGSKKRSKYGVIGRHVNLTSRIESYTTGGQILASESTINECISSLRIDNELKVMPKGVKEPINIYEIGGVADKFNLFLPKKQINLTQLNKSLTLNFTVLEGKHSGSEMHGGTVNKISKKAMEIITNINIEPLSNIKIALFNDIDGNEVSNDIYAKVISSNNTTPNSFIVNLTSVPPVAEKFIEEQINNMNNKQG